ncbi:hypothetical protein [Pseudoalteromonas sp. B62]|uniref:hypothetical protein n=1 Tax=Pseudoalteromonas sp. B62 TaxID=630483 RepID=UPI00301CB376
MKKYSPLFIGLLFSGYAYAQVPLFEVQHSNFTQNINKEGNAQSQFGQPLFELSAKTNAFFLPVQGSDIEFIKSTASTSATGNLIWVGKSLDGDEVTLIKSTKGFLVR